MADHRGISAGSEQRIQATTVSVLAERELGVVGEAQRRHHELPVEIVRDTREAHVTAQLALALDNLGERYTVGGTPRRLTIAARLESPGERARSFQRVYDAEAPR